MHVLSAASECFPLIKTGGLGDVVGALPKALAPFGVSTKTILPGYPVIFDHFETLKHLADLDLLGEPSSILSGVHDGHAFLILSCPSLFERGGGPYLDDTGRDHHDNWKRFGALSLATAQIAAGRIPGWRPDIVHTHDWHTGLAAAYMKAMQLDIPVVMTIHNLAFQGKFPLSLLKELELPEDFESVKQMEYYGDISFLKAGITLSDAITTVSPTYAREILLPELGMGMEGILSDRRDVLRGIVNGIDTDIWNPATDPKIEATYDSRTLTKRRVNRSSIQKRFGLEVDDGAILSIISRLTWQKGIDLVVPVIPGIVDRGAKLVVCGQGDSSMTGPLLEEAAKYPGRVAVHLAYSEIDAHRLQAGSDIVVQPSRFEPCGLTQLYALRYGAVPIVARTGGLAETIIDANEAAMSAGVATGFQFAPGSVEDLYHGIDRALIAYDQPEFWRRLQAHGMKADFSWSRSAEQYADLYSALLENSGSTALAG